MKKYFASVFAVFMLLSGVSDMPVYAEKTENKPIYAEDINDGTYPIDVTSSSSMFKIVDCQLTVSGGEMTAVMTLSGTGYEKLFMGTGDNAINAADSDYIYFSENEDGKYSYTVPVVALDKEIDCAAWSIKKEQWYDRTIVFESSSLPDGAVNNSKSGMLCITAAAILAVLIIILIIFKHKRKNKSTD